MRSRLVRNGDVELAVFEDGPAEAPTVLFVHGWPDSHVLWNRTCALLADRFHVVSYDTRGHGASSDPGDVDRFTMEEMATDLVAVAEAVSPGRAVHLVGHDWGSVQGWEAVTTPGAEARFASYTSISGPSLDQLGHWIRRSLRSPRGVLDVAAQLLSSWYVWLFVTRFGHWLFSHVATPRLWSRLLRVAEGLRPGPDQHGDTLIADMTGGLRIYRANVVRRLRDPRDRRTTVPVLQLVPTRDIALRGASYAETPRWASRVERRPLPLGHWMALSHPEVVAEHVAGFVEQVEAGR